MTELSTVQAQASTVLYLRTPMHNGITNTPRVGTKCDDTYYKQGVPPHMSYLAEGMAQAADTRISVLLWQFEVRNLGLNGWMG